MYKNVVRIAENVEGETAIYKNKFSNLEKSLKDLSEGGLFGELERLIKEVHRLTQLTEKYEIRYFLLSLELERRGKIMADYLTEIESYRETLVRKDREHVRELERIRDEETYKIRRALEVEIEKLKTEFNSERSRYDRKIQELSIELNRRDHEGADLMQRNNNHLETISKLRIENEDLQRNLKNGETKRDFELNRLRNESQTTYNELEQRFKQDLEAIKRQAKEDNHKDQENNRRALEVYYLDLLRKKDEDLFKAQKVGDQGSFTIRELESELAGLRSIVGSKNREISELREQFSQAQLSYEGSISQLEKSHAANLLRMAEDKDRSLAETLAREAHTYSNHLQDKNSKLSAAEQRNIQLDADLKNERRRAEDLWVNLDDTKRRLEDAERTLREQVQITQETYTIQIEERDNEVARLKLQIKELNEMCRIRILQETERANNLGTENALFKKEIDELKRLGDERSREIDEWRMKYKGYITGDDADNMRDEVNRLRKLVMDHEDGTTRLKLDNARAQERFKQYQAELDTKEQEITNLKELNSRRRDEVINVQHENDKLIAKIRSITEAKDNVDAQKMMGDESVFGLQREIAQLKEQCDMYKDDYERSQTQLALVNKKYADNLREQEELMKNFKNPTIMTSTVRSSQMITKTTGPA